MLEEELSSLEDIQDIHLTVIVSRAYELYDFRSPVKILDLATGPNGLNPLVVNRLVEQGIDYELTLSDISPVHLSIGYKKLAASDPKKIKCVLADSRNLRKNIVQVPLWNEGVKPLAAVLDDPRYQFLQSGYVDGKRAVDFSDRTFDLVIGCIPYGSIGNYSAAIKESARVLKPRGYHIVSEMHIEEINYTAKRTDDALRRAQIRLIDIIRSKLDSLLTPIATFSLKYAYVTSERIAEQTLQQGDYVKLSVMIHQKPV